MDGQVKPRLLLTLFEYFLWVAFLHAFMCVVIFGFTEMEFVMV